MAEHRTREVYPKDPDFYRHFMPLIANWIAAVSGSKETLIAGLQELLEASRAAGLDTTRLGAKEEEEHA